MYSLSLEQEMNLWSTFGRIRFITYFGMMLRSLLLEQYNLYNTLKMDSVLHNRK